jgi:osmotically-inducible protein OsmY
LVVATTLQGITAVPADRPGEDITLAVEKRLSSEDTVPFDSIDVETTDGIVNLSGTVRHFLARERAREIAESINGVRGVVNQIVVVPALRRDRDVRDDILSALGESRVLSTANLDVIVEDGYVALTGDLPSWRKMQIVDEIVKGVRGVRGIDNRIRIVYPNERTDNEIRSAVERALRWDARVNDNAISVDVEEGRVSLSGDLPSAFQKRRAVADAWVEGVNSVDVDDLHVRPRSAVGGRDAGAASDREVEEAVRDALFYDPRLLSSSVEIRVDGPTVTLRGKVDSLRAKLAAEEDARNVVGISRVINLVKVDPEDRPDDTEIQTKVKNALARDPYLDRSDITVTVWDGEVNLYGLVDSKFEQTHAESVASWVYGTVKVNNHIQVRQVTSMAPKSDSEILQDLDSAIYWSSLVDGIALKIAVEDGVATLSGRVETWAERQEATKLAFESGAILVKNRLKIQNGTEKQRE